MCRYNLVISIVHKLRMDVEIVEFVISIRSMGASDSKMHSYVYASRAGHRVHSNALSSTELMSILLNLSDAKLWAFEVCSFAFDRTVNVARRRRRRQYGAVAAWSDTIVINKIRQQLRVFRLPTMSTINQNERQAFVLLAHRISKVHAADLLLLSSSAGP